MKVEVDVLGSPSLISLTVCLDVKQHSTCCDRAQVLCESGGGRPELPSLISLTVCLDVKQGSTQS